MGSWYWTPLDGADADYLESESAVSMMASAVSSLCNHLRAGESVLLHCSAGIHRTGAVGYAILRASGLCADAALGAVRAMRAVTADQVDDKGGGGRSRGGGRLAIVERLVL